MMATNYGYNFIGINEDKEAYTMTFYHIDDKVSKSFNLKSDQLVGIKFSVVYSVAKEIVKDEHSYEDEVETYTILALKKL